MWSMFALLLGIRRSCSSRTVSGRHGVEPSAESFFSRCADVPRSRGLSLVGQRKDEATELRVLGPDALLTLCLAPLELAPRRCPRRPGLDDGADDETGLLHDVTGQPDGVGPHRRAQLVVDTSNRLGASLVDRLRPRRQLQVTDPADAGIPQAHALFVGSPVHGFTVGTPVQPCGEMGPSVRPIRPARSTGGPRTRCRAAPPPRSAHPSQEGRPRGREPGRRRTCRCLRAS